MVEDNNIKATVSPFAIREGEIKVFDGKDGYVSMNQIIHRINIGHINEIHFVILVFVMKDGEVELLPFYILERNGRFSFFRFCHAVNRFTLFSRLGHDKDRSLFSADIAYFYNNCSCSDCTIGEDHCQND